MSKRQHFWLGSLITLMMLWLSQPTAAAPHPQPTPCAETYIIQSTDWLSKIAAKFLGEGDAYPAIVAATNQQAEADSSFSKILNPNQIEAGWKLCIPITAAAEALLTEAVVDANPTSAGPIIASEPYTMADFVNEFPFGPEVKAEWFYTSPEEQPDKPAIRPDDQKIHDTYGYRANYVWNEHIKQDYFLYSGIFKALPPELRSYEAPWNTTFPRYRYPGSVTLPTGLTTNQFGWRGPPLTFDKPEKTIRIACVGASTTVSGYQYPYAYPELLQHWLNLWAEEKGYDVNFEVINAGREGIGSRDIAAVVRYEIIPMDVDYVIYYEGANQFDVQSMVSYPAEVTLGQPPEGLVPNVANVDSEDKTILDQLSEYSALAARARNIVEAYAVTGAEPPKPEQIFHLAEGVDEFQPSRATLDDALSLRTILDSLDEMKEDLDQKEAKLLVATFNWFAYEGMILDPTRHRNLYIYLNRVYWPITYANMRRMADFQNRVFRMWAAENQVGLVDVAAQTPHQPDLFDDAIHDTPLGIRIRGWITFEYLVPVLKQRLEAGELPQHDRIFLKEHPYITSEYKMISLEQN